jgi:dephospho-CoA kinase
MAGLSAPYAVKEAALLFEGGAVAGLDFVVGVTAPVSLRLHRVMQRDGLSREQVQQRMQRQLDENIKMKLCDSVLVNDEQRPLLPQVLELHERLLQLSVSPVRSA